MLRLAVLLPLFLLPACATIIKGSTQEVALTSEPPGAICSVERTGAQIAAVTSTPASVVLKRNSADLTVKCAKPGFDPRAATVHASFNGVTFGNLLLGGLIGIIVDASTGANFSYPEQVNVAMPPVVTLAPAPAPAPAPYVPGGPIRLQPAQPGA